MTSLFIHGAPLLANQLRRNHPRTNADLIATWRHAAKITAGAERLRPAGPCIVTARLHRTDNRTTDTGAIAPTLKACIDGLVDAGIWPDDTPAHVLGELCLPPLYKQPTQGVEIGLCPQEGSPTNSQGQPGPIAPNPVTR